MMSANHAWYWSGVQPRRVTSRCHRSGWLSVHKMSVAVAIVRPGRSESFWSSDSTTILWLAWKSVWISSHRAATSMSCVAPSRITGGRVALATWGQRSANPWLGVVLDAVSAQTGLQLPPPGRPGPFALDDAEALAAMLVSAGLSAVSVTELAVPMRTASVDEWWERTPALAGPLVHVLAGLSDGARSQLAARVRSAVAPFTTPDGRLDLPGLALIAAGQVRPG